MWFVYHMVSLFVCLSIDVLVKPKQKQMKEKEIKCNAQCTGMEGA